MGRLFGTDGIRGIANEDITAELALNIGRATATVLEQGRRRRPLVVVGRDTRLSSDMLSNALTAGLCSVGSDVIDIGVIPTPAVAYLVGKYKADAGVMISASHNTYPYNGIKIFGGEGFKLPDEMEDRIEGLVLDFPNEIHLSSKKEIGTILIKDSAVSDYIEHLKTTVPTNLEGLNIAVDCSNGSASVTALRLFKDLKANATILYCNPNGININENCGSTHLENLKKYVVEHKLDAGIAFDGDADRCLCVDEKGNEVNGDFIMAVCALDMKQRGKLKQDTVVGTIMSNMGFTKFCDENNIRFISTKVGDRYVLEEMEQEGYNFGGEQSGHVIFRDFATTGDGELTAIQLMCYLKSSKQSFSELTKVMKRYPQVLKNLRVSSEGKLAYYNNDVIRDEIRRQKDLLDDKGRVVVRLSGTEPLIRVMVEGEDEKQIEKCAQDISAVIETEIGTF